jgi:hypothetical protein
MKIKYQNSVEFTKAKTPHHHFVDNRTDGLGDTKEKAMASES